MVEFSREQFTIDHREKIAWMIETEGWAIEPVAARADVAPPRAAYAYTIGLADTFGFADVVVYGLTPVASRGLLGEVVGLLRDGVSPPVGPLFTGLLDNDLRCALLPVDTAEHLDEFSSATNWYGHDEFSIVQLVWPDRSGWMPWESGYDVKLRYAQPLMGRYEEPD
jgi:hypothetical protein